MNKKKWRPLLIPIVSILVSLPCTSNVYAQEGEAKQGTIVNITDKLEELAQYYYKKNQEGNDLDDGYWNIQLLNDTTQNQKFDVSGSTVGDPIKGDEELVYLGDNTFDNTNSPIEQTFNTSEFSRSVSYTYSTTTTLGFSAGGKGSIQIPIPTVPTPEKNEFNLQFNYASAETYSTTTSDTVVATRQPIKVPAGKKYKVTVNLNKVNYYGKVALKAFTTDTVPTFTNSVTAFHYDNWGIPTQKEFGLTAPYDYIYFLHPNQFSETGLKLESNAKSYWDAWAKYSLGNLKSKISFDGDADYSYEVGVEFSVKVDDITNINDIKTVAIQNISLR